MKLSTSLKMYITHWIAQKIVTNPGRNIVIHSEYDSSCSIGECSHFTPLHPCMGRPTRVGKAWVLPHRCHGMGFAPTSAFADDYSAIVLFFKCFSARASSLPSASIECFKGKVSIFAILDVSQVFLVSGDSVEGRFHRRPSHKNWGIGVRWW